MGNAKARGSKKYLEYYGAPPVLKTFVEVNLCRFCGYKENTNSHTSTRQKCPTCGHTLVKTLQKKTRRRHPLTSTGKR